MYKIEALNDQAKGICYVDNKITFVDNCLPGDIVDIKITKETKKYNLAKVTKYIEISDNKIKSFCKYSDICGGCQLSIMNYTNTIEYKKNKLEHTLSKFAKIKKEINIIPCNKINYRNKITLKIVNDTIGYYMEDTNDIVEINKCMIANDTINKFIKYISDFEVHNGEVVIRCNYNDELLINFITNDPVILPVIKDLKIVGILHNGNILMGSSLFMEQINNMFFQVSYDSFFQINRDICSKLFDIIKDNIIKDSNVIDLYCGVGTLGINIAKKVNKVYGIEIVPNAIINAITNAKMNKCNNINYMLGDATKVINKINDKIDVIICDPPRSGLTKEIIKTIKDLKVKQIIYVSCDPITLSRDISLLNDEYELKSIEGLDMFPYTYHVESISILERR